MNMKTCGILVRTGRGETIGPIFAELRGILGDYAAIQKFWATKGATANLLCIFCKNVTRTASALAEHSDYFTDIAETDLEKFDQHSDASFHECVDRLLASHPSQVEQREITYGLHRDPAALASDTYLRQYVAPVTHTMLDPNHMLSINGIAQFEFTAFFLRQRKQISNSSFFAISICIFNVGGGPTKSATHRPKSSMSSMPPMLLSKQDTPKSSLYTLWSGGSFWAWTQVFSRRNGSLCCLCVESSMDGKLCKQIVFAGQSGTPRSSITINCSCEHTASRKSSQSIILCITFGIMRSYKGQWCMNVATSTIKSFAATSQSASHLRRAAREFYSTTN